MRRRHFLYGFGAALSSPAWAEGFLLNPYIHTAPAGASTIQFVTASGTAISATGSLQYVAPSGQAVSEAQ